MSKRIKYSLGMEDEKNVEVEEWLERCFTCRHQYCTRDNPDEIRCSVKKCKYEKEQKNESKN